MVETAGRRCKQRRTAVNVEIVMPVAAIRRMTPDEFLDWIPTQEQRYELVVEVLSASTGDFDPFQKLEEYKTVPSLRHVVIVNPDEPQVIHWRRPEGQPWDYRLVEGLDAAFELPDLTLALADLYEGLEFRPRLRLVAEAASSGRTNLSPAGPASEQPAAVRHLEVRPDQHDRAVLVRHARASAPR